MDRARAIVAPTSGEGFQNAQVRFVPALRICLSAEGHQHHSSRPRVNEERGNIEKGPAEFEINMLRCLLWLLPGSMPGKPSSCRKITPSQENPAKK